MNLGNTDSLEILLSHRLKNSDSSRIAIVNSAESCTWEALSAKISTFSERYHALFCAGKNNPLVIHGHKEIDFVAAIYACLLNKVPFIPVDNIYPESRLNDICELSKASHVYRAAENRFEQRADEAVTLEEQNLAYIMFTSGTTGKPKGVQIGRECVFNLMLWMKEQLNLSAPNVFMNQAPFAFDLSMYEIFGNLAYGGTMVLNSRSDIHNPETWLDFLNHNQISTWVSTPSFAMQQLMNPKFNQTTLPSLKEFLFCGEKLNKQVVGLLFQKFPDARVINSYGPTEATVATTYIDITREMMDAEDDLPVGYPVLNSTISIENEEICISGIHVMRGYLNNPEENSKRLLVSDTRTYKTGDYGFFKDNMLYCKGRADEQIKLNGYRIELSEIEEKMLSLKTFGFDHAAVIALKRSTGAVLRLVAFYTSPNDEKADEILLKTKLEEILPPYMIPSEFIKINAIPVSTNHKTDKKALLQKYQNGEF